MLAISHGGIVEAAAVACLPDADHAAWGDTLGYCEGVRLVFDGERFVRGEILRVCRGDSSLVSRRGEGWAVNPLRMTRTTQYAIRNTKTESCPSRQLRVSFRSADPPLSPLDRFVSW